MTRNNVAPMVLAATTALLALTSGCIATPAAEAPQPCSAHIEVRGGLAGDVIAVATKTPGVYLARQLVDAQALAAAGDDRAGKQLQLGPLTLPPDLEKEINDAGVAANITVFDEFWAAGTSVKSVCSVRGEAGAANLDLRVTHSNDLAVAGAGIELSDLGSDTPEGVGLLTGIVPHGQ